MGNILPKRKDSGKECIIMKILVKKTDRLQGEITAGGSKNAALPIMAATILCGKKCKLYDIPNLADIIRV